MPEEKLDVNAAVQSVSSEDAATGAVAGATGVAAMQQAASTSMAEIARSRSIFQRPRFFDYAEQVRAAERMRELEVLERAREQQESSMRYSQAYGRGMRYGAAYDPDQRYMERGDYSDRATEEVSNFMDRAFRGIHLTELQARHLHAMIERSTDPYEQQRDYMRDYMAMDTRPIVVPMKVEAKVQVSWKMSKTGRKFRSA